MDITGAVHRTGYDLFERAKNFFNCLFFLKEARPEVWE